MEDAVKPIVKPIGDAARKVLEDPEGFGLTRPFTPKVHVPPSTVGRQMEREQNNGWSSASGDFSGDSDGSNSGWSSASGDFSGDSDDSNSGFSGSSGSF